jgi:hypothetical protein
MILSLYRIIKNERNKQLYLGIIIMLALLMKSIGLAQAQSELPLLPRQVNLSGNIVQFSMPENFSKDFPADDLVESVDLANPKLFSQYGSVLLLQRYWDFRTKGFFSKNIGTLQMAMVVKKVDSSISGNIVLPAELIKAITADLKTRYDASNTNKEDSEKIRYSNLVDDFVEFRYNNQRWIRYSIWKDNDRELTSVFAIPVTNQHYLTVAFSFAPSNKIAMRDFIDGYAQQAVDRIMETFMLLPNKGNSINNQKAKLSQ